MHVDAYVLAEVAPGALTRASGFSPWRTSRPLKRMNSAACMLSSRKMMTAATSASFQLVFLARTFQMRESEWLGRGPWQLRCVNCLVGQFPLAWPGWEHFVHFSFLSKRSNFGALHSGGLSFDHRRIFNVS